MKKIITIFYIVICFILATPLTMIAAGEDDANTNRLPTELTNPIKGNPTPSLIIGSVIEAILGIVGSLALLMFIYGGFTWMLAAGNNERVQKGRDILIWATIGLVVIFSSYAMIKLIFQSLGIGSGAGTA